MSATGGTGSQESVRQSVIVLGVIFVVWWFYFLAPPESSWQALKTSGGFFLLVLGLEIGAAFTTRHASPVSTSRAWLHSCAEICAWGFIFLFLRVWFFLPYPVMLGSPDIAGIPDTEVRPLFSSSESPLALTGNGVLAIGTLFLALLIAHKESQPRYRTVQQIRRLTTVLLVLKSLASLGVIALILGLSATTNCLHTWGIGPPDVRLRNLLLASFAFCWSVTLWRQCRQRLHAGDRSPASLLGIVIVPVQFLSFIVVVGAIIALLLTTIESVISATFALGEHRAEGSSPVYYFFVTGISYFGDHWFYRFTALIALLSFYYLIFYLLRRLTNGHGLSWADPVHWRTLPTDVYYQRSGSRLDNVNSRRKAYVASRVAAGKALSAITDSDMREKARIAPVLLTTSTVTFRIIGDPGEGDASQLRLDPFQPEQKTSFRNACVHPSSPADLDFAILSSDIIYPAGELMDYERALYRIYGKTAPSAHPAESQSRSVPIYAHPGNHDWYDDLRGFLLNLTFLSDKEFSDDTLKLRWPWANYTKFGRSRRKNEIQTLRKNFQLENLGGTPGTRTSYQQLPFFEMTFPEELPLVVIAVDTGCAGLIDDYQKTWLTNCLRDAEAKKQITVVLLSRPLYVDGKFDMSGDHIALYELLRTYKVDVVMAGDTHAYQHYLVHYEDQSGHQRTMHHIVNGGGGAYLSSPVVFTQLPTRLAQEHVYADIYEKTDDVTLLDVFPTADLLRKKFGWPSQREWKIPTGTCLEKFLRSLLEPLLLRLQLTNFLDHDWPPPLLQSAVHATLFKHDDNYELRLTPELAPDERTSIRPAWKHQEIIISAAKY